MVYYILVREDAKDFPLLYYNSRLFSFLSFFEEIRTLIEENTREELRSELVAITEEIEEWQAIYDVEAWEDLEQSLANGDLASSELRERCDVIAFWRENEEDRRLIKHALELYSDVEGESESDTVPGDDEPNG